MIGAGMGHHGAMDLTFSSAIEQAAAVAAKEVSATELLETALGRYDRHNPALNAVIVTKVEEARDRAGELDAATSRGESLGPLHGVPMTIKEAFDWTGTPTTWGIPAMADNVAATDATAVQRLTAAGAVIYGKTNVPYALGDWQSFNDIYGTTNNPWDLTKVPGGSSGGSAAALATGMATLEIGSDIGASIRNPAHYCGVFGHKPTYDLIPMTGHALPGHLAPLDIGVVGPLARTAADLDLALGVLAGPDGFDAVAYRADAPASPKTRLSDFKVGVMLESPVLTQDSELTAQLATTIEALAAAGVKVDWDATPDIDQESAHLNYLTLLRGALGAFLTDEEIDAQQDELARYLGGARDYEAVAAYGLTISHRDWWHVANEREQLRLRWAEFFETYDLLLCPIAASAAFPHDHDGTRASRTIPINDGREPTVDQLFWAGWSCNVFLPGTVAPAGLTASGLPCGLQIVAPHLQDRTGIAFAKLMEAELGGFVVPPGYE